MLLKCAVPLTTGNGTIDAMPVLSPECNSLLVTSFLYLHLFTPIKAVTKIPYGVLLFSNIFLLSSQSKRQIRHLIYVNCTLEMNVLKKLCVHQRIFPVRYFLTFRTCSPFFSSLGKLHM